MRLRYHVFAVSMLVAFASAQPAGAQLAECTIDFETSCPSDAAVCGATFTGGLGCQVIGAANCYTSGVRSYRVDAAGTLEIDLAGDLNSLQVFFANHDSPGVATGTMTFFDAGDNPVGAPLVTNGNCAAAMPDVQSVVFGTPVRSVSVSVTGTGSAWIDDFHINPPGVPIENTHWSRIKAVYRD